MMYILTNRQRVSAGFTLLEVLIGMVIFAIGVPWLYAVRLLDPQGGAVTIAQAIHGGFVVFIPAMILKSAIAVLIGRWAAPWASRRIW